MARARNIKPALFKNEVLGNADPLLTLLFEGLWCLADREGRLEDRPARIKAEVFPYRAIKNIDVQLQWLADTGFIRRYSVAGTSYIDIPKFKVHQSPHHTERKSVLPEFPTESDGCSLTVNTPLVHESTFVKIPLIPDSLIPDSGFLNTDSRSSGASAERLLVWFTELWDLFPVNFGAKGSRKNAEKEFIKLSPDADLMAQLQLAIKSQISEKQNASESGVFCPSFPHVERWLKDRRWEDEVSTKTARSTIMEKLTNRDWAN